MDPASNSPGLAEVVGMAIDSFMMEVHTCAPGVVVSYDASTQTAAIQPSLLRTYKGQSPISLPQIENVPVVFPSTATAWVRLPVAAGDSVMLHFSERSLDKWLDQGGLTDPAMPHKFDLTDAIATPGLRAKNSAIVAKGAASSIELANGNGWFEISPDGRFKASNGTLSLLTIFDNILTHLQSLTTVGSPTTQTISPASIAQLAADQVELETLKL